MPATRSGSGVLYLHGDHKRVETWVRRGAAPCYVVPLGGWTAVVPGSGAQTPAPYDDSRMLLAARKVPSGLRSALGLFDIDGRVVVTVHPTGWRPVSRWLVWDPTRGVARVPSMASAGPADLVRAAGAADTVAEIRELLAERSGAVAEVLVALVDLLALPGDGLVVGRGVRSAEGSALVEPDRQVTRQYERIILERNDIRESVGGAP